MGGFPGINLVGNSVNRGNSRLPLQGVPGGARLFASIEANDEFVETLDGLMARLKDSHNAAVAAWGAGRDEELIEGSEEEDRRTPPSREPHHDPNMAQEEEDRAELLNRLYSAQTELPEGRIKRPSKRVAIFRAPGKLVTVTSLVDDLDCPPSKAAE